MRSLDWIRLIVIAPNINVYTQIWRAIFVILHNEFFQCVLLHDLPLDTPSQDTYAAAGELAVIALRIVLQQWISWSKPAAVPSHEPCGYEVRPGGWETEGSKFSPSPFQNISSFPDFFS